MFLPTLKCDKANILAFIMFFIFLCYQKTDALALERIPEENYSSVAENFMKLSKYDSAIFYYDKLIKLSANDLKWDEQIKYSLKLVEAYRRADKFRETDSCLNLIATNKNYNIDKYPLLKAEFLHQKGTSLGDQGKHTDAIEILDQVVQIRTEINGLADTILAKTYNNIGTYFYYLGNLNKASSYYEKALQLAMNTKSETSNIASFMQNIGIIYARMGDFEKALKFFNDNLRINQERLPENDPDIAQIYLNLGQLYSLLSRYDEALEYNDKAEQIYTEKFGPDYGSLGTIYLNKSRIYGQLSDTKEAERYLKNALRIYGLYLKPNHPNMARIYNNLGSIAMIEKDYAAAKDYLMKSLSIQKGSDSQIIQMRNLANALDKLGNYDEAEKKYKKCIDKALNELGDNHFEYGNSLEKYSQFLIDHKRMDEVEKYILKAIDNHLLNYNERNANVADIYLLYGQFFDESGDYHKALKWYQKTLIANNNRFSDTNVYVNPSVEEVISESIFLSALLNKAKAFSKLYAKDQNESKYLEAGIICYEQAMPVFEDLRSKLKYDSKFILMEETSKHFNRAYDHYFNNYQVKLDDFSAGLMFEFAEKNKAGVLLASMKNMDAIKFGGIPEEDQLYEKQLKERINGYENLIYNQKESRKPDSNKIVLWEKRLFNLTNRYDSLIQVFGKEYPAYYDLKYDHKVLEINKVQSKLSENELIIEYTLTDSILYTFLIGKDKVNYYRSLVDSVFHVSMDLLQKAHHIDFANHHLDDFKNYVTASYKVYNILFSEIEGEIEGKKLIIIPDGKLGYLAFESLVTELPDMSTINYRDLNYLIKDAPISYSYSSTLLYKNNSVKSSGSNVLAFAPSYGEKDSEGEEGASAIREVTRKLKPLLNAQTEVSNVIDIFDGEIYNQKDATETNFKLNSPEFDVLHLAMHTIIDDEDPMYSKMIFTADADSIDDGYLNTYEIYNLDLKAQLAVLSACNTGSGKILNGEGIMSLARGFIYSGVPSIVMTLWEVDDKSGADIMSKFYSNLKDGLSKDEALQKAKIEYINSATQLQAHPYFWSAYVNIGNNQPLRRNHLSDYLIYSAIIIFSGLVLFFLKRKKLSRRIGIVK